jgi:RNA polymerase sigma-70 factor (ECF subfamily)
MPPTASPTAKTTASTDDGRIAIDRAVAERFAAGDHAAVQQVFERWGSRIRNYIWLMVGDRDTAEELAQETFLAAYQRRDALRSPDKLGSWLIGIARNLSLKELRRRRRRPEYLLDESGLALLEETSGGAESSVSSLGPAAPSLIASRQLRGALRDAFDALRESERELLAMRYFAQMPLKEIAEALDMPMGSVGATIKRALDKLRARFAAKGMALEDFL